MRKYSNKVKWFTSFGIGFDDAGSQRFANDFVRNVKIFCVDNSSLYHADNCKNNFLVSSEGPIFDIYLTMPKTKFLLSLY